MTDMVYSNNMSTTTIDDDSPPGAPEWFVTFADLMSLLLAFFVMLVSMGGFEKPTQFHSLVATLQEQFGHRVVQGTAMASPVAPANADDVPDAQRLGTTHSGGVIYFAELATGLTDENKQALVHIARQLMSSDAIVELRGHSALVALTPESGLRDLWDLADRRCHSTMAFLIEQGVDASRIRLANAGTSEPLYMGGNTSEIARNSRVEIRLMPATTDRF
jgi:chemotaxis protein MotB